MPPNYRFELDNCELDWTYPDNTFDFIHIRCLIGSIKDWVKVYSESLRCLKPGGWLEHTDFSIIIQSDDSISIPISYGGNTMRYRFCWPGFEMR